MIAGQTESGKSTLAHALAGAIHSAGSGIVVYDPTMGDWPVPAHVKIEPFIADVLAKRSCVIFIDEAHHAFEQDAPLWLATLSRHLGHSAVFIAQRAVLVPRTVRDQCGSLMMFASSLYDCEELGPEWGADLRAAAKFPRGRYVRCDRYGTKSEHNVF